MVLRGIGVIALMGTVSACNADVSLPTKPLVGNGSLDSITRSTALGVTQPQNSHTVFASDAVNENYFLYTKKFASRFNLPDQGVETLSSGLEAVALNLAFNPIVHPFPICSVKVFLKNDLPFVWPERSSSYNKLYYAGKYGAFFTNDMPFSERKWIEQRKGPTNRPIFHYRAISQKAYFSESNVDLFDREYYQGITYMQVTLPLCDQAFDPEFGPYEFFIKKDLTHDSTFDSWENDGFRFDMPRKLASAFHRFSVAHLDKKGRPMKEILKDIEKVHFKIPE